MRLVRAQSCVPFLAFFVIGCRDVESPRTALLITADSARYAAQGTIGAWVWVSIRNVSSRPVQLAGCGGFDVFPEIERAQSATWVIVDTPICSRTYAPLQLDPGTGIGVGVLPKAAGTYRIRAPIFNDAAHMTGSTESSAIFVVY